MTRLRHSPVLLVCCALLVYFGFHALHGKHGLEARSALQARALRLAAEHDALKAVRALLAQDVALLAEDAADPDFVEELARTQLGLARPGDRILLETDGLMVPAAAPRPERN